MKKLQVKINGILYETEQTKEKSVLIGKIWKHGIIILNNKNILDDWVLENIEYLIDCGVKSDTLKFENDLQFCFEVI